MTNSRQRDEGDGGESTHVPLVLLPLEFGERYAAALPMTELLRIEVGSGQGDGGCSALVVHDAHGQGEVTGRPGVDADVLQVEFNP